MSDDPVDVMKPWTIKSVTTRTANGIIRAAQREGLTVGQWLDKRFAEWEGQGSPVPVKPTAVSVSEVAAVMQGAAAMATAGLKVPSGARSLIAESIRTIRGPTKPKTGKQLALVAE